MSWRHMKLVEEMPGLAKQLEKGLIDIGEIELANSVNFIEISGRCDCGDLNCGTFYTLDKSIWSGNNLRQVFPTLDGLYAIDVFENKLACVEILDRDDVCIKLDQLFRSDT